VARVPGASRPAESWEWASWQSVEVSPA
jgi:hypothetical protein